MESFDAYLKEQKRFYQTQYRFFYSYLKHQQEASQDLEAFVANLQEFIPGYACETCLKPMFEQLAHVVSTAYEQLNQHIQHMTTFLPNIYADDEIKAMTTVFREHKALANNLQNSRQRQDASSVLQDSMVAQNEQFVKAAASFEYDRIRKMRQFCYELADSLTRVGAKTLEQCPKLHEATGEVNEFAGHLSVCQKFASLDCGESIESILGVQGLSETKNAESRPKEKKSKKQPILTQVVLHTGDSPRTASSEPVLRQLQDNDYPSKPDLRKEDADAASYNLPRIQLNAERPVETFEEAVGVDAELQPREPLRVPRFDFGDSLLEDADEDEGAAEKLLRLTLEKHIRSPEAENTGSADSILSNDSDSYGLEALLQKEKELEELEAELFPPPE